MHTQEPKKIYKKLIVVDFDGVLHDYDGKWTGPGKVLCSTVPGALRWLEAMYMQRDLIDIAIYSSRSKYPHGRWAMKRWLYEHLEYEFGYQAGPGMDPLFLEIFEWIKWPWFKPAAFLFIDDRAHCFTGEWPAINSMLEFKPWNRHK